MIENNSLPHLPEGIEGVVVVLTFVFARISNMVFNRAIKRGKAEPGFAPTGLLFSRCYVVIIPAWEWRGASTCR